MSRSVDGLGRPTWPEPPRRSRQRRWPRWIRVSLLLGVGLVVLWTGLNFVVMQPLGVTDLRDQLALLKLAKPGVYLVLFQNPHELRSTGGLVGSFAEVETGWLFTVKRIQVETNIYKREQAYPQAAKTPPLLLADVLGTRPWTIRESNWALDFRHASRDVQDFYTATGGRPVDGVIAIDTRLLERLLRLTGPVAVRDLTLTADSITETLQTEVERNYFSTAENQADNEPKTILVQLVPTVLAKLKSIAPSRLLREVAAASQAKEFLTAFADDQLAEAMYQLDWDGHLPIDQPNLLLVNESTYSPVDAASTTLGAKSSWSIEREANLEIETATGQHTLHLSRYHAGQAVWPDGPSHGFLRVAVPHGSELISMYRGPAEQTDEVITSTEAGATVFALWSRLNPGDGETITLTYRAPGARSSSPLALERQPGVPGYPVTVTVDGQERFDEKLEEDILVK